ncbi:MAG: hypothetical protein HN726_04100 [Candidatus Magasanikbacteria bacterium]|jgi:signal transduction histidine kinase|nr:hypothetical protein [Candidatus Magasanikbacteria bacterium]MBT4220717.1 hypothetical protein [Candidatus Magasanikbacteria bacterium]MBT4350062.1 hypothetical protein [Candidatus Magasanikbacteria bacterium]MBT4541495.1 hypothetical protein [Candidatus Magasanikbacteria bacterium]MBT6253023.1 hypothetical protein [Candidatus Magasanikbacteria bacterium]
MESILSIQFTFFVTAFVSNILLAVAVFKNPTQGATHRIFVWLTVVTSLWVSVMYISVQDFAYQWSLILIRLSVFLAAPMSMLFFLFSHTIPNVKIQLSRWRLHLCFILTGISMLLALSPFTFSGVEHIAGELIPIPGLGLLFFVVLSTAFSLSATLLLIRKFLHEKGKPRRRFQLILTGIFLMLGFVICTILIPVVFLQNSTFVSFAPVYTSFFLITTGIAIIRYQLFNIKVIATESLVIVLAIILFFEGLLSGSFFQLAYKFLFAGLIVLLGAFLIKSVKREIQEREEIAHLAKSLEKANIRLHELDRQKTEFLSIASHQLRTPLSIIKGYIELIEDGVYGKVTRKMKKVLHDMDDSNERLVKLIDEFLDITRIEQGRTKFTFEDKDMNELITSVVHELTPKADTKKLKLIWKPTKSALTVCMDEERVRHVVFNFIDNAIKYTNKGKVRVMVEKEKEIIIVRVRDSGIGFNKEDQASFFHKFYRGENVKGTNINGTGLGIYVARKFIEKHKGEVWAVSPGLSKGSEFGFSIPIAKKQAKKKQALVDDSAQYVVNQYGGKKKKR